MIPVFLGGQFKLEIRGQFKLELGGQLALAKRGQHGTDFPGCKGRKNTKNQTG